MGPFLFLIHIYFMPFEQGDLITANKKLNIFNLKDYQSDVMLNFYPHIYLYLQRPIIDFGLSDDEPTHFLVIDFLSVKKSNVSFTDSLIIKTDILYILYCYKTDQLLKCNQWLWFSKYKNDESLI